MYTIRTETPIDIDEAIDKEYGSPRCISAVKDILMSEDLTVMSITLGEAETAENLSDSQRHAVAERLHAIGFELLDDPRSQLVEQIRIAVQAWVRMDSVRPKLSDYLSCRLPSGVQQPEQVVLRGARHHHREVRYPPSRRVRQGAAMLQQPHYQPDSLPAGVRFTHLSVFAVQAGDGDDASGVSRAGDTPAYCPRCIIIRYRYWH